MTPDTTDPVLALRQREFLPPHYTVYRLAGVDDWARVPRLPALLSLGGRHLLPMTMVWLAWTADGGLRLRAAGFLGDWKTRPALPPDSPDFWRQDHVEFRFLPDPENSERQLQIIVTPHGTVWDNAGLWRTGGVAAARVEDAGCPEDGGPRVELRLSLAAAGLPANPDGLCLRGLVSRLKWTGDSPHMTTSSPLDLGFSQAERFGEFRFRATAPPTVSVWDFAPDSITLFSTSPVRGKLRLTHEHTTAGESVLLPVPEFAQGVARVCHRLPSDPCRFARTSIALVPDDGLPALDLGAITWRAPLPAPRVPPRQHLQHPYLLFSTAELAGLRAKAGMPFFRDLLTAGVTTDAGLSGSDIPAPDARVSMAITPTCMNWFRVAKETMLRDGAGDLKPAAARLWARQSPAAQEAWRGVVGTVNPAPEQLAVLVNELNVLLAQRDLYDAGAFAKVRLPHEARALLARGLATLDEAELQRFNRILLQSSIECMHNYRMDLVMRPGQCLEKWLVSGDVRLVATATRAVRAALRLTILGHEIHLHEGMAAGGLALAYDAFHPHLTPADRKAWRELLRRFLSLYLETACRHSWTVTTIANANPVGNGGCGLAALALWHDHPAEAREALSFVRDYLWNWLDYGNGAHGGNTEGVQYWQYGMENFLRFAVALERVTGSDDGLLSHPAVTKLLNMVRVSLTNDGALHGVNDTVPMPIGGALAWFAAQRFGDPLGLWYGDHARRWLAARKAAGKPVAYGAGAMDMLLWRPPLPECTEQPPLPTAFALPDIEYAILRSGTPFDCRWVAGLKGSRPPYTHHNQPDTGSFFCDLRGERLLIDPGYYKDKPEHHCLPLLGGRGPVTPSTWTGRILVCDNRGDIRYAICDATAAYAGAAFRVQRHLLLAGDEALILLDDIITDVPVTAQYQCGGATTAVAAPSTAWLIRGQHTCLRADVFAPGQPEVVLQPERSLHDVHWGYHFADCRWFPVTLSYQPDPVCPLVTVLTEADAAVETTPPAVLYTPPTLSVRLPSGRQFRLTREHHTWRLA